MKIIKLVLQYLIGFYLMLSGLVLTLGGISVVGGSIVFISSFIIFPKIRKWIEQKNNFYFNKSFKYLFPFFGFILSIFFVETDDLKEVESEVGKTILVDFDKIENKDSVLVTKDNLLLLKAKNNLKKDSVQQADFFTDKTVVNSLHDTPKKKASTKKLITRKNATSYSQSVRVRKKRNNYRTTSSVCGAKNRSKSGYCRRRVKGGGLCWQHR